MDDKEYYSLMNRSSSWALQQALKKKQKNSKKKSALVENVDTKSQLLSQSQALISGSIAESYKSLEARQGSADAQMLMEKGSL